MRSVYGTSIGSESQEPVPISFDTGGILFGSDQITTDLQAYQPSQWQALQLWQTFINNVDPMLKILHIPTAQAEIYGAINNPISAAEDLNALMFSIYFAAVTSLSSSSVVNILGEPKVTALGRYKKGLEQSLLKSRFLDSPSMRSLQAWTIYIVSNLWLELFLVLDLS